MYVDNQVIKEFEEGKCCDRFVLASALMDMSFKGAACSLLEGEVLEDCSSCSRQFMCRKIDETVEEYTEKTTVVKANFSFE